MDTLTIKKGIKMKNEKGFTLIELIICIAIFCIITVMVVTAGGGIYALYKNTSNNNTVIIQQQDEEKPYSNEGKY